MTNTYNHIQNLVDEKIIKRELKGYRPEFAMTFVFPSEYKEQIRGYVAEKGKKHIVEMITQKAVEYNGC